MVGKYMENIAQSKKCFKCGEIKTLDCFYKHAKMGDGHINKCKDCTKKDVQKDYRDNHDKKIAYDKIRQQDPERRKKKLEYQITARKKDPDKNLARSRVNKNVRAGKLTPTPCQVCGEAKTEAHHPDYTKPLKVVWLCRRHHSIAHGVLVNPKPEEISAINFLLNTTQTGLV